MPRVKLQKPSEAERLDSIAVETGRIIRMAMIRQEIRRSYEPSHERGSRQGRLVRTG